MCVLVGLGELHFHKVQPVLADVRGHLLYGDGALPDGVEGLRVVVVLEVRGVVVCLGAAIVLERTR